MNQGNCTAKTVKYQHLTEAERKIIERQTELGTPKRQIARLLGRNISTVRREIKRGSVVQRKIKQYISKHANDPGYTEYDRYFADVGQREYENNRLHCGAKCKITACRDFVQYAEEKILSEKQSPDAVVGNVKKNELFAETVTTKTLYNWIDKKLFGVSNIDLLLKVRRKQRTTPSREHKKKLGKL